jgi:hypothetical protein
METTNKLLTELGLTDKDLQGARLPDHSCELDLLCMLACRASPVMPRYFFESVVEAVEALKSHKSYHGKFILVANSRTDCALNLYKLMSGEQTKQTVSPWAAPEL